MARRAEKLRTRAVHGVDDKLEVVREEAARLDLGLDRVAYVGNDVNDAACLSAVALPVVPADAWPEVVPLARWVLERAAVVGACARSATLSGAPHVAPDAHGMSSARVVGERE